MWDYTTVFLVYYFHLKTPILRNLFYLFFTFWSMDSFGSIDKLEGSDLKEKGGLVYPKGTSSTDSDSHVFKKPQNSIFGLDKLAAKKRTESRNGQSAVSLYKQRYVVFLCLHVLFIIRSWKICPIFRNYREPRVETPSYGGGVSKDYLDSQLYKKSREKAGQFKSGLAYKTGDPFKHKGKGTSVLPSAH